MRSQNVEEFMRVLPDGWNRFKIQTRFKSDVNSEFYNSNSRGIWKLDQKGELFYLKFSSSLTSSEIFQ
jgi:hypothetical protein